MTSPVSRAALSRSSAGPIVDTRQCSVFESTLLVATDFFLVGMIAFVSGCSLPTHLRWCLVFCSVWLYGGMTMEERIRIMLPLLDERQRRIFLAVEAKAYGRGSIAAVSRLSGAAPYTIRKGIKEIGCGELI